MKLNKALIRIAAHNGVSVAEVRCDIQACYATIDG